MNILKEKIAKAISNHVSLEDTYTYELKRVKSAFEVGTMSLEDFEEWTEENVEDLAETIVDALQPQLNENQEIVLEYLKEMCPPKLGVSAMVTVYCLVDDNINDNWQEYSEEIPEHIEALQKLSVAEENQVIQVFIQRVLEQESGASE